MAKILVTARGAGTVGKAWVSISRICCTELRICQSRQNGYSRVHRKFIGHYSSVGVTSTDGRAGIDAAMVRRLVAAQFPQWSDLAVSPVQNNGWDNRTYRLGADMSVRLPTAVGYVPAVAKEVEWIPRLAPALPVAVPLILGQGEPGEGYPYPWSIRGWLAGETADQGRIENLSEFAVSVAECICPERDWTKNEERLCCLLFDSHDDDVLSPCWKAWLPISVTSPGTEGSSETVAAWMWDLVYSFKRGSRHVQLYEWGPNVERTN